MKIRVLALFILVLLFGVQTVFFVSYKKFDDKESLAYENAELRKELINEKIKNEIAKNDLEVFRQKVASVLPKDTTQKSYSVRNIASLVRSKGDANSLGEDLVFKNIKRQFLEKDYEKVGNSLLSFIEKFPNSVSLIEAYYLLVVSLYESSQYEKCLQTIDIMVDQFPESELTGLSLITMGDILRQQERYDEAQDIYKTVLKNFPYQDLKLKAHQKLEEMKL